MSKYWIEFGVPHTEVWWNRISAPDFSAHELPCRELYEEMLPFGIDPQFPDDHYDPYSLEVKAAKAACERCPVQAECLEYALVSNLQDGIWGGTTPHERREIGRRLRKSRGKKVE